MAPEQLGTVQALAELRKPARWRQEPSFRRRLDSGRQQTPL